MLSICIEWPSASPVEMIPEAVSIYHLNLLSTDPTRASSTRQARKIPHPRKRTPHSPYLKHHEIRKEHLIVSDPHIESVLLLFPLFWGRIHFVKI